MRFQYRQIIPALPQHWKETKKHFAGNLNNLYIQDHHLIKCNTIYNLEKRNSGELYHMQLLLKYNKPTHQDYLEKKFDIYHLKWKLIYRIPVLLHMKQKFVFSSMYYILLNTYFIWV